MSRVDVERNIGAEHVTLLINGVTVCIGTCRSWRRKIVIGMDMKLAISMGTGQSGATSPNVQAHVRGV